MDWRTDIQRRDGESLARWSLRRGHLLGHHDHLCLPAAIDSVECAECLAVAA